MAGTPHGNAQWASRTALYESRKFHFTRAGASGSLPRNDLILGKWVETPTGEPHPMHTALYEGRRYRSQDVDPIYLTFRDDGHIMTVAPTRTGKGQGLIIPNLLNYSGNVIVIDPKGENFEKTKDYRESLGQDLWCFDPFKIKQKRDLHGICVLKKVKSLFDQLGKEEDEEESYSFLAEVSRIAEAMVVRKRDEKDPFFNTAAQIMIKDAIILSLYSHKNDDCPPLSYVRKLFLRDSETKRLMEELDKRLAFSEDEPDSRVLLAREAAVELSKYMENRDVVTTAILQTEFLEDDNVAAILDADQKKCSFIFDPDTLNADVMMSIFLIIPPQHLMRQSRFLRLFVTLCIDTLTRRNSDHDQLRQYHHILFILDEIAQLGPLDCIQKAAALGAGYKMTLWMFWQDLSQLKGLYPEDWMTFLSNSKIQQFFGCNDIETAKYISERCGPRTQFSFTETNQFNTHGFHTDVTSGDTRSKIAGELLRPSEVLRADNKIIFHFCQGYFPFMCERIEYNNDAPFINRYPHGSRN